MSARHPVIVILRAAKRIITEIGWTQDDFAKDREGNPVGQNDSYATCFCAGGAVFRVAEELNRNVGADDGLNRSAALSLLRQAAKERGAGSLPGFNDMDGMTAKRVATELFDPAIAEAEARFA